MFVFTFVARLFTFQYDRPHFEPLLRLPPNRARTHIESPIMFRVIKLFMSEILPRNCRLVSPVHPISNIMEFLFLYQDTRRVNPPNLPLRRGNPLRSSPAATQQQAVCKKGSPRWTCSRASQGRSQPRTTDRTSNRCRGSHRTGQLSHPRR